MHERLTLALAVPELRAAALGQIAQAIRHVTELTARQAGRPEDALATPDGRCGRAPLCLFFGDKGWQAAECAG
jgi:MftR C-terminal domain